MLDLKGPGHVSRYDAEVLRERDPPRPVLVCSRWWPGVNALADMARARAVLTARNAAELRRLLRRVRRSPAPYGVSLHHSLITAAVVAQLRTRVELVMTWPVNSSDALSLVLDRGVNCVIRDEPAVLRGVLELAAADRSDARPTNGDHR